MKKVVILLLAVTIICQSMVYTAIGIYYHLNKEYIARQLCENRGNPQLHCNGRCYLSKQLKKAESGESRTAQIIKEQESALLSSFSGQVIAYPPPFSFPIGIAPLASRHYDCGPERYLIKPPIPGSFNSPLFISSFYL